MDKKEIEQHIEDFIELLEKDKSKIAKEICNRENFHRNSIGYTFFGKNKEVLNFTLTTQFHNGVIFDETKRENTRNNSK